MSQSMLKTEILYNLKLVKQTMRRALFPKTTIQEVWLDIL